MKLQKRKLRYTLLEDMLGSAPKNKETYDRWIQSKKPPGAEEDESACLEGLEESGWTCFLNDENGIFVFDYQFKGFLKEAGNTLKEPQQLNVKNLRHKIVRNAFVAPRRCYFGKEGPDGVLERPLRATTQQGPRVTLVRSDYIEAGLSMDLELWLINNREVDWKTVEEILDYGLFIGLGQNRPGGYGRFDWQWLEDPVQHDSSNERERAKWRDMWIRQQFTKTSAEALKKERALTDAGSPS